MEKFDSLFHKRYVTGDGIVVDKGEPFRPKNEVTARTLEELESEYRAYVNDPMAQLPEEVVAEWERIGRLVPTP